ncbi:MAG: hypothetical protein JOZ96_06005 [Acidobacteria bacterium]|nr:hypothetical protein [Acidobacteriota bacterium]
MLKVVWRLRWRLAVGALCFFVGLLLAYLYVLLAGRSGPRVEKRETAVAPQPVGCGEAFFASPDGVLAALKDEEVGVRREIFRRLFLRPGVQPVYYDYERDKDFPERAEEARLRFVNLDDSPEDEALVTFVRADSPVAVVLKQCACGWRVVGVFSPWLRFEDYPYADWIELPEAIRPGRHLILVRESNGDATSYTRRARVFRLAGDHFEQVAAIDEETIAPVEGYTGAGWADVKTRRVASYSFTQSEGRRPARLNVEYKQDWVKYSGGAPANAYWREGDGAWHEAHRHWRTRLYEVIKAELVSEEHFVWSEQKSLFVAAGS